MTYKLFVLQTFRAGTKPYIIGAIIKVRQRGALVEFPRLPNINNATQHNVFENTLKTGKYYFL